MTASARIPLRRGLDLYANVRPVRLLEGITSPLAGREAKDIDFVVVRENVEGEYSEIGGRLYAGTESEQVSQLSVFTRRGVDRILRYAYELADRRPRRHLTSATKSNGIMHTMPVLGSAPDIAGQGVANPVGAFWTGAMMLGHLGENDAETRLMGALESVLVDPAARTPDLGGQASTSDCETAVLRRLERD